MLTSNLQAISPFSVFYIKLEAQNVPQEVQAGNGSH